MSLDKSVGVRPATTKMIGTRRVTTSGDYSVNNTELYAASWPGGTTTWIEATSVRQAKLLHTLLQKERPLNVWKETQNGWW